MKSNSPIFWGVLRGSCLLLVTTVGINCGGGSTSQSTTGTLPGTYLLAFHACDGASLNCSQPTNHTTYLAYSADGASWSLLPNFTGFSGSVPDLVRRGSTLYVYNPGKVRRYNILTETWQESDTVTVQQSDGTREDFVDPSPYLDPTTGKIVLFYLASTGVSGDPAQCTTCPIRSAAEVEGSDGKQFVVDEGDRALVQQTTDPDIFFDGSKYYLYLSKGAQVIALTSTSLKGTYTKVDTLSDGVLTTAGGVPAGHYDAATGKYWTYIHNPSSPSVIKRAVHSDFSRTLSESDFATVVSGATFSGLNATTAVQSPGFAVNQ